MRARFELDQDHVYGFLDIDAALEAEVNEIIAPGKLQRYPDDYASEAYRGKVQTHVVYEGDVARMLEVLPENIKIKVLGTADPAPLLDMADRLSAIEQRLNGMSAASDTYVNTKVDVHVPGNMLLTIDEVKVMEDLCSDALNGELVEGWRIVAVCPQPDQRRPDYVLGRRSRQEGDL